MNAIDLSLDSTTVAMDIRPRYQCVAFDKALKKRFGLWDDDVLDTDALSPDNIRSHKAKLRFVIKREPESVTIAPTEAIESFLRGIEQVVAAGELQRGMVQVVNFMDQRLKAGNFEECDVVLQCADEDSLDVDILLTMLTVTAYAPADDVPSRAGFYQAVRRRFTRDLGPKETAEILDNLQ